MPDIWMDVDANVIVPMNIMPILDDTDFKTVETGVVYNTTGLVVYWNFVTCAGAMTSVEIHPTTGGSHDISEPMADIGIYAIEIPASGGDHASNDTEGTGWITGKATGMLPFRGPTIGFRRAALNDLLIEGGTASTNLEDMFDGTGYAGGTTPLNTNVSTITNNAITAAAIANGAIDADTFAAGAINAAAIADGAIDAATFAAGAINAAAIANAAIDADTFAAGAINAAAIADGAIDAATFAAGAINAAAIANAAIDFATFAADCVTGAGLKANVESVTNNAITAAAIADNAIDAATFAADVDAEIATMVWNAAAASYGGAGTYGQAIEDILATDLGAAIAEMTGGAPTATPTLKEAIMYLYMAWRNKVDTTATLVSVTNNAGAVICKATLSDDATTFSKAEFVAP